MDNINNTQKKEIKFYLENNDTRGLSLRFQKKYPIEYNYINTNFTGRNIFEKCYKYFYEEKRCLNCKKTLGGRGFLGFRVGYRIFCSDTCASKHPYRLNKIKQTNRKRYGVSWLFSTKKIKEKIKKTNFNRWGVEHVLQNKNVIDKKKKTCLDRYGVENYRSTKECQDKIKNTCIKKYGVESASQNPQVHTKQQKSAYKIKLFILPSGKKLLCQGYEPFALQDLLKKYNEKDIVTNKKLIPQFWYFTPDNKKHKYFPDIFIPNKNLIIEVKSTWTDTLNKNIILLKKLCVENSGYLYQKMVYDRKGRLINEIKN